MMGGAHTSTDLQAAFDILRGLSDPAAGAKIVEAQLAVAQDIDAKRIALDKATEDHERAAKTAIDTLKTQETQRVQLEAQLQALESREAALTADMERFSIEQSDAMKTRDDGIARVAETERQSMLRVASADAALQKRDESLQLREAEADQKIAEAKSAIFDARSAQARADALIEEHQAKLDAIRKAAGL